MIFNVLEFGSKFTVALGVIYLTTVFYKALKKNWKRKQNEPECTILFDWNGPCRVGEHVTFRVSPKKKFNVEKQISKTVESTPLIPTLTESQCNLLMNSVVVHIKQSIESYLAHPQSLPLIEYIKEVDPVAQAVVIKFLVRTAGTYEIKVTYNGQTLKGSPYRKTFVPSYIEGSKCVFLRPSSTILCTPGKENVFKIQPKDRYGNNTSPLNNQPGDQSAFTFTPSYADESFNHRAVSENEVGHVFLLGGNQVELVMTFNQPGVYKGKIAYGERLITNGSFDVLCLTWLENAEMLTIIGKNPAWTPHKACLVALGDTVQMKTRNIYLFVSSQLFYVQEYLLGMIPLKIAVYRVSPMTKIKMIMVHANTDSAAGRLQYTFVISDGIQPEVTVQMDATKARIVLGMFCYFLQNRLDCSESYEDKQRLFYSELQGLMSSSRMTFGHLILISRGNIVDSSLSATKSFNRADWCKNFGIKFENEIGSDLGGLRREWLELLCVQFFRNDPSGMFCSIGTSRLVHPNVTFSRSQTWKMKHYELAGKIVGKCLFESSCGATYIQMVNARFSRSFLAQILGFPPNYQHFEQDDPELFLTKIKYVLNNDVSEMDMTFSEEEYDANGKLIRCVDLIPRGAKQAVTSENKEQYLNALAQYRLRIKCEKEITAFKKGLHAIVPEEILSNFNENELELLMCGNSKFDVEDLRQNYKKGWSSGKNTDKLINWFFISISNMSDEERARLLQFTTGSSLLPHGGLKSLSPKFKISVSNERGKLPLAHTCFNEIVLSEHDTFEKFERALKTAISEGAEGFAFA